MVDWLGANATVLTFPSPGGKVTGFQPTPSGSGIDGAAATVAVAIGPAGEAVVAVGVVAGSIVSVGVAIEDGLVVIDVIPQPARSITINTIKAKADLRTIEF